MRVAVTGSHGLIGTALIETLEADGDEVTRLPRGAVDKDALEGHDAVVNLAGAGLGDHRWTDAYKAEVLNSRVETTTSLARALSSLKPPPRVLVSGSAVGYYGDRGNEELTESSAPGAGFLASVAQQWEAATAPAADAGIRVVNLRTGIVMSGRGGALKKQLLPFKLGLGGRTGNGRQYLSWVSLDDEVGAIRHALGNESIRGPLNATAPNPVTNAEFAKTFGRVLHRPTVIPLPTPAVRLVLGRQLVSEMLLGGQRVLPAVLQAHGYEFRHPELEGALLRATA